MYIYICEAKRMEKWSREMKAEGFPRNPSFSSALLDAIYRSTEDDVGASLYVCRKTMTATTTATLMHDRTNRKEYSTKQTPCPFKWTTDEKKTAGKLPPRRNISELGVFEAAGWYRLSSKSITARAHSSTTSSSTESSGFSSSEADSVFSPTEKKLVGKKSQYEQKSRPPPVIIPPKKHNSTAAPDFFVSKETEVPGKSRGIRVSKIYNELKKAKQPVSPGSRIASFLNSLFASAKKAKPSSATTITVTTPSKPALSSLPVDTFKRPASRASSTASTTIMTPSSRSCLSKSPSTLGDRVKRSARFFPMNMTVGEDSRPCGHKCLYEELLSSPLPLPSKELKVKDLIADYQKKSSSAASFLFDLSPSTKMKDEEDDEDDDAASCSSSDLFELENLTELPVYETTSLETNRAIAKGLIL